ncbi:MAG: hypothetical protein J2P21_26525, partial [Chloracidobacterium sp.]|nr:hypothetical protein [Chloracidobacterium sp.]
APILCPILEIGISSAEGDDGDVSATDMKNNDDIPTTDTNEINRVKRGELDQGDALLIEKLLTILLMIVSLLQRKHTSIRRAPAQFDVVAYGSKQVPLRIAPVRTVHLIGAPSR